MRFIRLAMHVRSHTARDAYQILSDFDRYPQHCDAVQHAASETVDGVRVSHWEVKFRSGLLRWSEADAFDPDALTITFRQLTGDVARFEGAWRCSTAGDGADVVFAAWLDMGVPSLADALEPIAARTLIENTVSIVRGLMGDAELLSTDVQAITEAQAVA